MAVNVWLEVFLPVWLAEAEVEELELWIKKMPSLLVLELELVALDVGVWTLLKKEVVAIQDEQVVQKCAEKLAAEVEGSTSPLPERVQVGYSPVYKLDRKLGKGGFGQEWIMEQWDKNYYITSVAGACSGSALVVMSQGVAYTQQSYKVSDIFPFKWINKKWNEGFSVTSMTTAGSKWGIVMSRNAGYPNQVVELDFLYPSEGIHRRWESGYRITSTAATADQAAFIFSAPKRKSLDVAQETLRTSVFPSNHVKLHRLELLEIHADDPKMHVLFIPGLRGVTFYKDFVESLYEFLGGHAYVTGMTWLLLVMLILYL
ncbi:hypothetical protein FH972_026783 [Carpinus fangiana]|uniref:DUF7477 domain-containing protein n=1 Tax=Carpinus fangiana TaxID=176857 RepID=A0A5N6L596_9ROSI|nr:hypothetical protein FH972_026783 [Carpinus fangiana]